MESSPDEARLWDDREYGTPERASVTAEHVLVTDVDLSSCPAAAARLRGEVTWRAARPALESSIEGAPNEPMKVVDPLHNFLQLPQ